jgi:hypothetical protein
MEKKILIVDDSGLGKREIARHMKDNDAVIVVENHIQDDSFELNGVIYAPIKKDKAISKGISKLHGIMAMAQAIYMPYMHAMDFGGSEYQRKLPKDTNIIKEYELIQRKESSLSKWERDMVVLIFERNFNKVER